MQDKVFFASVETTTIPSRADPGPAPALLATSDPFFETRQNRIAALAAQLNLPSDFERAARIVLISHGPPPPRGRCRRSTYRSRRGLLSRRSASPDDRVDAERIEVKSAAIHGPRRASAFDRFRSPHARRRDPS